MLRLLLFATLAANVVLAATWWQRRAATPSVAEMPSVAPTAAAPSHEIPDTDLAAYLTDPTLSDADTVARLRAAGVPGDVIRLLITPRVHARFVARWQALVDRAAAEPYWTPYRGLPRELRRDALALNRDEHTALVNLLGDDALLPSDAPNLLDQIETLTPAQRAAVRLINEDYAQLNLDLLAETGGMIFTAADRAVAAYLAEQRESELRELLGPAAFAAYTEASASSPRNSTAAVAVQNKLLHFDATETEYLALFDLYQASSLHAYDRNLGPPPTPAEYRAQSEAWTQLLQQFAATLPADRALDLADALDRNYSRYNRFAVEHGLGSDTTRGLLRLDRALTAQDRAIRADPSLTPEQRAAALGALVNDADRQLAELLPPSALAAFPTSLLGRRLSFLRQRSIGP